MSRFKVTDPCIIPGCSRQRKTDVPFCARCWAEAEDGEREMVLFALHAPFWRARHDDAYEPGDVVFDGQALPIKRWYGPCIEVPTSRGAMEPVSFVRVLQEYEQRTTLRAVADAIRFRRLTRPVAADLPIEEDDPSDP